MRGSIPMAAESRVCARNALATLMEITSARCRSPNGSVERRAPSGKIQITYHSITSVNPSSVSDV